VAYPVEINALTPLSDGYREEPYWWREAPPTRPPSASIPTEVDVVVIGGGYTGMMAAARLAWRGRAVAVLDANDFGWGASGRNGGMVHPGFKVGPATLIERYGDRGRKLYRASLDGFELVERTIADQRIDCDYVATGHLELADKAAHVADLRAKARVLEHEFGLQATVMDRDALATEVGSTAYHGGLLVERSGGLNPAKYLAGLVALARDRGAHLYARTPATAVERRRRAGFSVSIPQGRIDCGHVLIATNGYSDRLLPWVRRRVIPIGSYIIATEPLSAELSNAVIPHRRMLFDTRNFLHYWRLSADNRMLFGGRASFAPTSIENARDWLYAAMVRIHPQLKTVKVEHAWGGQVGFTFDRLPHIGETRGIHYALGYCGTGVAMSTYFGQLAADWVAGGELPGCWRRPFPTIPLYRDRPWFLRPAGWYYALRDRL
jgi:glycine/D-amino acid oxidase-like deaminating enzyme